MAFRSWTNRRWTRVRYTYDPEERYALTGSVTLWTFHKETRIVERFTAQCIVAGVDSQTVVAAVGETLPTVYIPTGSEGGSSGGAADTWDSLSGTNGWTVQVPDIEDIPGGTRVTVTWQRATEFADASGVST